MPHNLKCYFINVYEEDAPLLGKASSKTLRGPGKSGMDPETEMLSNSFDVVEGCDSVSSLPGLYP